MEAEIPAIVGSSPVVCDVYGVTFPNDYTAWIVMQFSFDGDLHNYISRNPLPLWKQIKFCWSAAAAVSMLHNHLPPILHRDIKSYNFLVHENYLSLADFGLAKYVRDAGTTLGTLAWTPPEVLSKSSTWTTASDIYSLGTVFYEIVSTELPFEG